MGKDKLVPALEFFFLSVEPWCVHCISACPCHSSSSHTGLCTVPRPPRITVQWGAVSLLFVWLVSLVWLDCQIEPPWTTQLMVILLVRCSVSGLKSTTAVVYFDSHCLCDQYTPPVPPLLWSEKKNMFTLPPGSAGPPPSCGQDQQALLCGCPARRTQLARHLAVTHILQ